MNNVSTSIFSEWLARRCGKSQDLDCTNEELQEIKSHMEPGCTPDNVMKALKRTKQKRYIKWYSRQHEICHKLCNQPFYKLDDKQFNQIIDLYPRMDKWARGRPGKTVSNDQVLWMCCRYLGFQIDIIPSDRIRELFLFFVAVNTIKK